VSLSVRACRIVRRGLAVSGAAWCGAGASRPFSGSARSGSDAGAEDWDASDVAGGQGVGGLGFGQMGFLRVGFAGFDGGAGQRRPVDVVFEGAEVLELALQALDFGAAPPDQAGQLSGMRYLKMMHRPHMGNSPAKPQAGGLDLTAILRHPHCAGK